MYLVKVKTTAHAFVIAVTIINDCDTIKNIV